MWLSFKFSLSAAPIGYEIVALKDLCEGKILSTLTTIAVSRVYV